MTVCKKWHCILKISELHVVIDGKEARNSTPILVRTILEKFRYIWALSLHNVDWLCKDSINMLFTPFLEQTSKICPILRHIEVKRCKNIRRTQDLIPLPWHQLTSLSLVDLGLPIDPLWISSQLTPSKVTSLCISHKHYENPEKSPRTPFNTLPFSLTSSNWPNLTSLSLDFWSNIVHYYNSPFVGEAIFRRTEPLVESLASLENLTHLALHGIVSTSSEDIMFLTKRHLMTFLPRLKKLIRLQLPPLKFSSKLEPIFHSLTSLQQLKFLCITAKRDSLTHLKGFLSTLPYLESLSIGILKCCPSDIFPDLGLCTRLNKLKIDNMRHYDHRNHSGHFAFLWNMRSLTSLKLSGFDSLPVNPLPFPDPLCAHGFLKTRLACSFPLASSLSALISRLTNLKYLTLRYIGKMARWTTDALYSLPSLTYLHVEQCDISLESLSNLSHLSTLKLACLTEKNAAFAVSSLKYLHELSSLQINFTPHVGQQIRTPLSFVSQLKHLELQDCGLVSKDLQQVHKMSNLRSIHLGYNMEIDDAVLDHLTSLGTLETMDLSFTSIELKSAAKHFRNCFPHLRKLNISNTFACGNAQWELSRISTLRCLQKHIDRKQ